MSVILLAFVAGLLKALSDPIHPKRRKKDDNKE